MSGLELFAGPGTLEQRMVAVAQGTVLGDVVKAHTAEARTALEDSIRQLSAQTGTAFTARTGGVSALLTDPQPKPHVTHATDFYEWTLRERVSGLVGCQERSRVEVLDHAVAADAYADIVNSKADGDPPSMVLQAVDRLLGALDPGYDIILPDDPFGPLVDVGRIAVTPDGVVDIATGELVPGTAVSTARPTLQVRLDKKARTAAAAEIRSALGLPEVTA
jgi:hypothetical protein